MSFLDAKSHDTLFALPELYEGQFHGMQCP